MRPHDFRSHTVIDRLAEQERNALSARLRPTRGPYNQAVLSVALTRELRQAGLLPPGGGFTARELGAARCSNPAKYSVALLRAEHAVARTNAGASAYRCVAARVSSPPELHLYGDIADRVEFGITPGAVAADLARIGPVDITVRINSIGGSALAGLAIFNLLVTHRGRKQVIIDAACYSAASTIAMAGNSIAMGVSALMMLHDPENVVCGTPETMRKEADALDRVAGSMAEIYARRSGASLDQVFQWMAEEQYFSPNEAYAVGLCDRLL